MVYMVYCFLKNETNGMGKLQKEVKIFILGGHVQFLGFGDWGKS